MVRPSEIRKRRYEEAMHPDVVKQRFEDLKPVMVEMESEYLAQIVSVEATVKSLVEAAGIPSFQVAQYINVGRQCYSLAKRFSQATRDQEAQRVVDHWAARGLDGPLLAQACLAGGCNVTAPAPSQNIVYSTPPAGKKRITNIYWDPDTEEYVFEYEG